ncbi:MAG: hypothetical protein JXR34_05180 [Bacteroidales bacterium]|nr:hypothetical protein [Bacteroidales bacterium]
MDRNFNEEQIEGQLEDLLKNYQTNFSANFAENVMEKIYNELVMDSKRPSINWWRDFSRIVIPAAAVVIILFGVSFILEHEVSKDALIGTADLTKNSVNPFLLDYWTY